jgi:glycerol-3-phosphate O-acyltransferase
MVKKLMSEAKLYEKLRDLETKIPKKYKQIIEQFIPCYKESVGSSFIESIPVLIQFLELVEKEIKTPHTFKPYSPKIRSPIDYYQFGLDFLKPLIDLPHSSLEGQDILEEIEGRLEKGANVVLFANHQIEADPQVIATLLSQKFPKLAEKIIYVAGERVITDPLAIPFSMGCDLLCIYSKRHIDNPPELKAQKLLHNKHTLEQMKELLQEGGKIIYVAPSGGRDRKNSAGVVEIAKLDPSSIELFYLMTKKVKTATHFYPLTLATYDLLPPPDTVQKDLGERRTAKRIPVHLVFSPEFDMEIFPGSDHNDKIERRQKRADHLWEIIHTNYVRITQ